jgi:hypothetical protein
MDAMNLEQDQSGQRHEQDDTVKYVGRVGGKPLALTQNNAGTQTYEQEDKVTHARVPLSIAAGHRSSPVAAACRIAFPRYFDTIACDVIGS